MKTKIFTLLFAVLASVGTISADIIEHVQIGDLYYNLDTDNQTAEVTYPKDLSDNYSDLKTISIPSSVEYSLTTYTVTSIGMDAFSYSSDMTSVEIPNSVISIGEFAFYRCTNLVSLTIPNSVTNIGNQAFEGCSGLTSIDVESGNSNYDSRENCNALIETATNRLIYGCQNTIIPNSVTSIESCAFYGCSGLTSVEIPNGVTRIGEMAFYRCSSLTSIDVAIENLNYCSEDGVLFDKDKSILLKYPEGKIENSYSIPNGVKSIENYAFERCSNLTSVTIPNSVTSIGDRAFGDCTSLSNVINYAPEPQNIVKYTVYSSFPSTFDGVDLSSVTLFVRARSVEAYKAADVWKEFGTILPSEEEPEECIISSGTCGANVTWELSCDSVLTISGTGRMKDYSYVNVSSLPWYNYLSLIITVIIEDGITNIGNCAFYGGSNLRSVTIPESVTIIGERAFNGCSSLNSITIPNSVKSIDKAAFIGCESLTSVTIPNGVTSIGDYAFSTCSGLNSVTIPNSVVSIGEAAFISCSSLISITIPNSIKSIGRRVFNGCTSITSMVVESGNATYDSRENCNAIIETATNTLISGCQNTIIPNGITNIGNVAFYDCTGLTSISIPNSVTNIGNEAFSNCTGLTCVINSAITPQNLNSYIFYKVDLSACTLYVPAESIEAYKAADVWKDFGTIKAIDETPAPCIIASGTCGENLTWELSCDSILTINGTGAMWRLTEEQAWRPYKEHIKLAILPEGIDSISPKAFYQCINLTSVNMPNSVHALGNKAFVGCNKLTEPVYNERIFGYMPRSYNGSYSIQEGIVSVAAYAFAGCEMMIEISIPSSAKRLGVNSVGAVNLTKITCYAVIPPTCNTNAFADYIEESGTVLPVNKSIPLYVPAESLDAYKEADQWREFTNILPIDEPVETEEANFNVVYKGEDDKQIYTESITLHLPVAPEIEGFTFIKWQVVAGDLKDAIIIQAVYAENDPSSAPDVYINPANHAQKLIRNGSVYILTDDSRTYTITGQQVR